ncbi:MAG: TonB-dependent receptor, partial [Pseudomonadota bacterium]
FFFANQASFDLVQPDSAIDSANEDYAVDEDIFASYLLARWESSDLLVIGGLRYERTDNTLNGFTTAVDADENVSVTPINFERDYDHLLPSLNIRYAAQDNLVLRLAGYRSLVRPNFEQLAPRVDINEDNEAVIGNPTLDPTTAWNLDASIEYYMNNNGAITAAFFYKDLDDYLTGLVIEAPGTLFGVDFEEAETFINGESAEVYGFEFSLYQKLDFLPGFLDGTLVQFNYTYTDASGEIADGGIGAVGGSPDFRTIDLPATSENTFNAVLGYEKAGLNLRLAGTYRDGFLDEINADGPDFDRFTDSLFQLDFTARYQATDNVQVYFEWININNAEFFAFNNLGGRQNILQYEEYNWTMKGGLRLTF